MSLVSIGEFARLSRLSPEALRLYDELGLLLPAHIDPDTGNRWYAATQLDQARLVASLRRTGVPLEERSPPCTRSPSATSRSAACAAVASRGPKGSPARPSRFTTGR
jgi:DNA-binding transcriptional MerR regulator